MIAAACRYLPLLCLCYVTFCWKKKKVIFFLPFLLFLYSQEQGPYISNLFGRVWPITSLLIFHAQIIPYLFTSNLFKPISVWFFFLSLYFRSLVTSCDNRMVPVHLVPFFTCRFSEPSALSREKHVRNTDLHTKCAHASWGISLDKARKDLHIYADTHMRLSNCLNAKSCEFNPIVSTLTQHVH